MFLVSLVFGAICGYASPHESWLKSGKNMDKEDNCTHQGGCKI